jgi:flagellar basal-body rod modification protein FlgD
MELKFYDLDLYMSISSVLQQPTILPSANPVNGGQSASEAAKERAEQEKVDFLNLLLTQLQNQNPLDPMDTDEFTAQLTRYSILEQGIETNSQLEVTNDLLKTNATAASFDYIGKQVEVQTNANVVSNGQAQWSYLIEGNPNDVKLTITDASGTRIDEVDGSIAPGPQTLTINAADYGLTNGQELYLSVNATDGTDAKINSTISAFLTVDGVWTNQNQNYLTAGELSFRASDVLKLVKMNEPVATPTPQPTS